MSGWVADVMKGLTVDEEENGMTRKAFLPAVVDHFVLNLAFDRDAGGRQ